MFVKPGIHSHHLTLASTLGKQLVSLLKDKYGNIIPKYKINN